jgi:protein tyrosine/serine phosphatase
MAAKFTRSIGVVAAALLLLAGVAAWSWNSRPFRLKDRFVPRRLAEVETGAIWRSGQLDAHVVRDVLVQHGIRAIVDLQAPQEPGQERDRQAEIAVAKELGIRHESYPMAGDGTGDLEVLAGAIASVARARRAGEPVLVHCSAGSRRTASVLFCYLLLVERRPIDVAQHELERFLDDAEEIAAQRRWLDDRRDELERELTEARVIEAAPAAGGS